MANTGHDWGSFAFVQESASDWDADALADDATDTSDAIAVDTKSSIMIGMLVTAGAGTIPNDSVTIAVLRTWDDTTYEDAPGLAGAQVGSPFKFTMTPVASDSVLVVFPLDPADFNNFKIAVVNETSISLNVSCKIKTADIPVAAA